MAHQFNYQDLLRDFQKAKDQADAQKGVYKGKMNDFDMDDKFDLNEPASAAEFARGAKMEKGRKEDGDNTYGGDHTMEMNGTLGIGGGGMGQIGGNMTVDDSMNDLVGLMAP